MTSVDPKDKHEWHTLPEGCSVNTQADPLGPGRGHARPPLSWAGGPGGIQWCRCGRWAQLPLPRAQPPHWANWYSWLGQTAPPTHSRLEPRSHPPLRACSWGPGSSRHTGSPVCRRWPPPCSPPPALPKSSPAASSLTWSFLCFSHLLTHQTGSGYEAGGREDLEGS